MGLFGSGQKNVQKIRNGNCMTKVDTNGYEMAKNLLEIC